MITKTEEEMMRALYGDAAFRAERNAEQLQDDIYWLLRRHGADPVRVWERADEPPQPPRGGAGGLIRPHDDHGKVVFALAGQCVFIRWSMPTERTTHVSHDRDGRERSPAQAARALAVARASRWNLLRLILLVKLTAIAFGLSAVGKEFLYWLVSRRTGKPIGETVLEDANLMSPEGGDSCAGFRGWVAGWGPQPSLEGQEHSPPQSPPGGIEGGAREAVPA